MTETRTCKGQIALVTGVGRREGIGFEIGRQLAHEGMTVILTARDREKAVVHAESTINGSTQAYLGTGADVTADAGTVRVRSISNTLATAVMKGGSGSIGASLRQ